MIVLTKPAGNSPPRIVAQSGYGCGIQEARAGSSRSEDHFRPHAATLHTGIRHLVPVCSTLQISMTTRNPIVRVDTWQEARDCPALPWNGPS